MHLQKYILFLKRKKFQRKNLFPILIPPIDGIVEGEDSPFDKAGFLFQLCLKRIALYMLWFQTWMLQTGEHHIITLDVLGAKITQNIKKTYIYCYDLQLGSYSTYNLFTPDIYNFEFKKVQLLITIITLLINLLKNIRKKFDKSLVVSIIFRTFAS